MGRRSIVIQLTVILLGVSAQAHIRMARPTGGRDRVTDDFQKFTRANPTNLAQSDNPGPCGPSTTPNNPRLPFRPGDPLVVEFTETINHPGRYLLQFNPDMSNPQNFWTAANQLGSMNDSGAALGTVLTINATIPNTPCENCAIRLLQQMDDQPGEYYVHCADIRIAAGATPNPTPSNPPGGGGENTKASEGGSGTPRMGGCGTISGGGPAGGAGQPLGWLAALLLVALSLRAARRRSV